MKPQNTNACAMPATGRSRIVRRCSDDVEDEPLEPGAELVERERFGGGGDQADARRDLRGERAGAGQERRSRTSVSA